ncbi:MAG: DNA primase [Lachnospirales bacterium]
MRLSQEAIDNVRESTDLLSLVSSYVDLKGNGNRYMGLCPFHKESTPSFNVSTDKQLYHCFGCGASGNAITFIMQIENYDFLDAIQHLADLNSINLEVSKEDYEEKKLQKEKLIEIHTKAARFFYLNLQSSNGHEALNYVNDRGISLSIQRKFGIGYATKSFNDLYDFLKKEGYDDDIIILSGLVNNKNGKFYDKFINRVMFPIFDVYGKVVAFGGRILGDGMPKYLNSPETPIFNKSKILYNLNYAKNISGRELILVEGYMDALMLYQYGVKNVVAALGTAFNDNHVKTLKKYCDKVNLLFDNDEAGVKAINRAIPFLIDNGVKVKVVRLNDAKDPDEYVKKFGKEAFDKLLKNSVDNIIFKMECLKDEYDLDDATERLEFIEEIIKILNALNNDIEREVYLERFSNYAKIDVELIKKQLKSNDSYSEMSKQKMYIRNSATKNATPKNVELACIDLCNILVYSKEYTEKVINNFHSKYIIDDIYKKLYELICDLNKQKKDYTVNSLVDYFEELEDKNKISKVFMTYRDYDVDKNQKVLNDAIKVIVLYYIEVRSVEVTDINEVVELSELRDKVVRLYI